MHLADDFDGLPVEQWATPSRLGIPDFDVSAPGRFYPQLYSRRFKDREEEGYAFLESQMDGKEPSFGYSVLAYLLCETQHKVVITTNFDNLVADALSIHSCTFPVVVGHDSLAAYARVELRRPLIAKVHGGLGFQPKNSPEDLSSLSDGWKASLLRILGRYTPIVIGYDGNDGSLMAFLEDLPAGTPDTVYWCFRSNATTPEEHLKAVPDRVQRLTEQKRGFLVPVQGFDEMMIKLKDPLKVPDLFERLKLRARNREKSYDEQQRRLYEQATGKPLSLPEGGADSTTEARDIELGQAVVKLAGQRKEKPWWLWHEEAKRQTDPDKQEEIYRKAIEAIPDNADLYLHYANFLADIRKDADRAEEYYRRATEANPRDAYGLTCYADFLADVRKDADRAEQYYKRAIEVDPRYAFGLSRYASYLAHVRNDPDRAKEYSERAAKASAKDTVS